MAARPGHSRDELSKGTPAEPREAGRPSVREVFDAHAAWVWRVLRHLGVGDADVQDVSQEVFIVVHRKLASFEGRAAVRTWLYGICLRVAAAHRRRVGRAPETTTPDPPAAVTPPDQHDAVERRDRTERLRKILDALDDDKRAVFVLYEIEGLAMQEVAEAIGCPLQTGYTRLHAARALVLEAWKRAEAKEER